MMKRTIACMILMSGVAMAQNDPFLTLMKKAGEHAKARGAKHTPVLSPVDSTVLGAKATVHVDTLHAAGFQVVPWTTNDAEKMKALIDLGVDGIITDRPDILHKVILEQRAAGKALKGFDNSAHRGGRGLRPENTLPSFESGMDEGATTLETDTGVTTDGVSLLWHDQFLNPESCRKADGSAYTMENRAYINTLSMAEAQKSFICDKLHFGGDQKNDLALSPVAVAFAKLEKMPSPYSPTNAAQLFRFVKFYTEYYKSGAGKSTPHASERAATGASVRFNLETKIMPDRLPPSVAGAQNTNVPADLYKNHSVGPQEFVKALCGAIVSEKMTARAEVQSFDFRTLQLVEEQYPEIPTYYLTNNAKLLSSDFVPEGLRLSLDETK
ncbi:glycerophosphodiester phosphodiesterase family protein [Terriglobus tenax]|uniref:glycerophosphodiester phosphodiesterase family protein n=1 Tax=Terriglobus tenax TaxID=1111115 RepID=UPI0021E027D7|nr:glycerophosphodiester phosphodiesterase family protein [Terriglobus tenax]